MQTRAKQIAELLRVLANENRLLIFCALLEKPMSVTNIAERVPNITQSAISQHLGLLKAHGILDYSKSGQNIIYSVADERVKEIIDVLKKHYCNK
ncbi:MAG: metalloregulator ArsR/SmtB family transcription factor [Campylobacteraceae bacterium]|jgi:DNA-binding transcriptional ArsR family regulator|nr:metalloregulator ArsR/SmtB family transcription factor [Campylobacteraceae bacterium]